MKYIVFGLGISGRGAKKLLDKEKLEYVVVDDKEGLSIEEAKSITKKDDVVIKSPGISWANPYLSFCIENGVKIISEIDFALKFVNKKTKLIAITGTNGKTTVVTKTYELLKYSGLNVSLGGNEGHSFCELISLKNDYDYIVLELSSYQLENMPSIKPYIALITNLTPDHLLRYDSVESYYKTKFNIFNNQDENDYAVINKEDKTFLEFDVEHKAKVVYMNDYDKFLNFETELKGKHNHQNMLNIIAIAKIINIKDEVIKEFLKTTKTLEHRMEHFYTKDKTYFINDSKGTNVESSLFAINAYEGKNLILICGGQDKKIDNTLLYQAIYKVKAFVLLIGENSNLYIKEFEKTNYTNYAYVKTMKNAVQYIKDGVDLTKETYVLLSPATASFDQYKSFEQRGIDFKNLVLETFERIN